MKTDDVLKAVECCEIKDCHECPCRGYTNCRETVMHQTLDLINRQKAKIEALQMDNAQLQSDIVNANMNLHHAQAEIERLEAECEKQYEQAEADILGNMSDGGTSCHWCIKQHKAKAIKEFAERLKEKYATWGLDSEISVTAFICDINILVKEMTEDDHAEE